ncbi:MAG: carboxypeptidase regulatory-like domain-containing protein [Verrucomicrobiia bacterium]
MKSRTIFSLFGLCLSAVCAWGGTYNVNVAPGYTLFGNQLVLNPDDLASTPLGQMLPNKSQILWWDGSTFVAVSKALGAWNLNTTLNVGEGFYCRVPAPPLGGPLSIPFTGNILASPTPIAGFTPTTTWYLLGSQTFQDPTVFPLARYYFNDFTGIPAPLTGGVSLYRARNAVPGGTPVPAIPPTAPLQWNEYAFDGTSWHPFVPAMVLGEAVWIGPSTGSGGAAAIEGTVTDNNGHPLSGWEISLSDGQYTFTDANGNYSFAVTPGDYIVSQFPACGWTTLTDPQTASVPSAGVVVTVPHFVDIPDGSSGTDLAVILNYVPDPGDPGYPCPNDTGYYSVHYYNHCGPVVVAGSTLSVTLSPWVTYGSTVHAAWSETPPTGGSPSTPGTVASGGLLQIGSTLYWTLGPLPASGIGEIRIPVTVGAVSPPPHPANPVTHLVTSATINPPTGVTDSDTVNNTENSIWLARCSFDPNDKTVVPAGCGPTGLINGNQLMTYTVQFQNLGSAPAYNVVVTDQLDPSLDPSTLKILGASHNYIFQLNGNQMTWTFPNIYLPDATDDAQGSHGFFTYQAQLLPGLADGTVITNQASVFFDLNPPVLTAITTNTITSATLPVASFTVAPRPGSAGHTNDFTYTGGTAGATFLWDFGPDAMPPTSTDMNPSGVVFPTDGLRTMNLQVFSGDCTSTAATYLLSVGQPRLTIASIAGNQVVLSWQGDGYSLEQSGTLTSPIPWQGISPILTQVGATHFATLGVTNSMMFYHLTDQP